MFDEFKFLAILMVIVEKGLTHPDNQFLDSGSSHDMVLSFTQPYSGDKRLQSIIFGVN